MGFSKIICTLIGLFLLQPPVSYCKYRSSDIVSSALQFIVDLYSQNHTEHEILSKIQSVFCPEQPLCDQDGERVDAIESSTAIVNDSKLLRWINQKEIIELTGLCCLPCLCDNNKCSENDNCCLTKQAASLKKAQEPVHTEFKNECIGATSMSYFSKTTSDNKYPHYSMVTNCFNNRDNVTLVTRCERPDTHDVKVEETIPVSSLITGRTYWNKYCAVCQNDSLDIVSWNATIYMKRDYIIFRNRSIPVTLLRSFSDFYNEAMAAGEVIYTKPSKVEPSICVPKRYIENVDVSTFHATCQAHHFLRDACENFDSPSLVYGIKSPRAYKNLFCLLCQEDGISSESETDCKFDVVKSSRASYTALLNHKFATEGDLSNDYSTQHTNQKECPCYTILDNVQHICRPVYCPPNEFLVLCKCMPFASRTSGMPFLLSIKVRPIKESNLTHQADGFQTLSAALRNAMEKKYKRLHFDMMAIFDSNKTAHAYQLHVLRAREDPGRDAKNVFKELADKLEGAPFIRFESENYSFEAELSNSVLVWEDSLGYKAKDTSEDCELQEIYTDDGFSLSLLWSQELSKLLFCKQVELNGTEYSEKHGVVTINVSSVEYQTTNYYHTTTNTIRICTEDFRAALPMTSSAFLLLPYTYTIFLCSVIMA